MKKKLFYLFSILCLFFISDDVFAAKLVFNCPNNYSYTVNVCTDGCEFDDLNEALDYIRGSYQNCDVEKVTLNIGEGNWTVDEFVVFGYDSFKVKGAGVNKTFVYGIESNGFGNFKNYISDMTIGTDNDYFALIIEGSKTTNIENVVVDARNSEIGIIAGGTGNVYIDNVKVNRARAIGIYNYRCNIEKRVEIEDSMPAFNQQFGTIAYNFDNIIEINNSDVSTSRGCGVVDGCVGLPSMKSDGISLDKSSTFENRRISFTEKTTVLNNTKLACAAAIMENTPDDTYPPYIYIPYNNTWTIDPIYDDNVVEVGFAKVEVEFARNKELALSNKNFDISSAFQGAEALDGDIDWTIDDLSIAKVENGKIIPLKVGDTVIRGTSDGMVYVLNLKVTNNLLNPNTNSTYFVLGIILIIVIGSSVWYFRYKN